MRRRLVLVHLNVGVVARGRAWRRTVRVVRSVSALVGVGVCPMLTRVDKVAGLVIVPGGCGVTVGVGVVGWRGLRLVLLLGLVVRRGHDPCGACDGLLTSVQSSFVGGANEQK